MIAHALGATARYEHGIALLDSALAVQREALGARHPEIAQTLRVRGNINAWAGHHREALVDCEHALTIMHQVGGQSNPVIVAGRSLEARSRESLGDSVRADAAWREALRVAERAYGATHVQTLNVRLDFFEFLHRRDDHAGAAAQLAAVERALKQPRAGTESLRLRARTARASLNH